SVDVGRRAINLADLEPEAFQAALDSLPDPVVRNSIPAQPVYSQSPHLQTLTEQQVARADKIGSKLEGGKSAQPLSHKGFEAGSLEHCPVADLSPTIPSPKAPTIHSLKSPSIIPSKPPRSKTLQAHIDR